MFAQWPHLNWVICHSPYSIAFDGVDGTDYGYTHHELKVAFGRTIGSVLLEYLQYFCFHFSHNLLNRYDLYWAKSGTFYRDGDGGFVNVRTPSFKPATQQYDFIQNSGRIMATYSVPIIKERPFTLEHFENFPLFFLVLLLRAQIWFTFVYKFYFIYFPFYVIPEYYHHIIMSLPVAV
jgi:hypothetical protein